MLLQEQVFHTPTKILNFKPEDLFRKIKTSNYTVPYAYKLTQNGTATKVNYLSTFAAALILKYR